MIEFVFLDLDDTILDFHRAEHEALKETLVHFGIEPEEMVLSRYSVINKEHWERLERREITRDQVRVDRFAALFTELGISAEAADIARNYESNLSHKYFFMPGAERTLNALEGKYRLFLASNGNSHVQRGRLTGADLYRRFEDVFVSQDIGYDKPSPDYFNACFGRIPGFDPAKALMVGDSLTSDILGGINAGIRTCWVNSRGKPGRPDIRPDYEIGSIGALPALLQKM